ncbi:MAG: hypothetical protein M1839_004616 [Geoglossum umbratile]|nr:MAG: hypothetical protein M1839_004616 [Geoglossum umbratile]
MSEATQAEVTSKTNGSSGFMTPNPMDQNGGSNGHGATSLPASQMQPSSSATLGKSPKKRRKVNHGTLCDRKRLNPRPSMGIFGNERPCNRCIKRNIGHLCHDEPREPVKKGKSEHENSAADDEETSPNQGPTSPSNAMPNSFDQRSDQHQFQDAGMGLGAPQVPQTLPGTMSQMVQSVSGPAGHTLNGSNQQFLGYTDWSNNQFQDIHSLHHHYMFNAPEVTNEYNLINDFLSNSLLDDNGGLFEEGQTFYSDPTLLNPVPQNLSNNAQFLQMQGHTAALLSIPPGPNNPQGSISRPASAVPIDKAREAYYLTAADPSGSDAPEERINKLLKAKYDAGMLKPFNYVKGYARLNQYMEQHMQPQHRQRILRQLDKFRPKFRERMHQLTDIELVKVEMWFETSLMDYDRVFASMAIPACCWRRTGEIFRGNKEMAELIHVPIEKLRDGKLAIHEIVVEESIVSYWEKFGTIAFDNTQKAMLTSCYLKNPDSNSKDRTIHCCFSFTIRRDSHNM